MNSDSLKTVLILEDDKDFGLHLQEAIDASGLFRCVGRYQRPETGLRKAAELKPDVVLFDLVYQGAERPEAIFDLRQASPGSAVLVLTGFEDSELVFRALRAGADGYVLKTDGRVPLVTRLQQVLDGVAPMSRSISTRILRHFREQGQRLRQSPLEALSEPELATLRLVQQGHTNGEIAARQSVTPDAIKKRMRSIMTKLRVKNRTEAAQVLVRLEELPR